MSECAGCGFSLGVDRFLSECGLDPEFHEKLAAYAHELVAAAIDEVRAQLPEAVDKVAALSELTALERFIVKAAMDKTSVIRSEPCTDSEGNKGSWVLMTSDGSRRLGCHQSREGAEAQERAVQAHKHGAEGASPTYNCECLSCGYTVQSEQHCRELACPKCGRAMRRAERPGIGA